MVDEISTRIFADQKGTQTLRQLKFSLRQNAKQAIRLLKEVQQGTQTLFLLPLLLRNIYSSIFPLWRQAVYSLTGGSEQDRDGYGVVSVPCQNFSWDADIEAANWDDNLRVYKQVHEEASVVLLL